MSSQSEAEGKTVRDRILEAAFAVFMESGYTDASTLAIATKARVSKRELYAQFRSKQQMLIACISERASRMQVPAGLPVPHDRESLEQVLVGFGSQLLREVSDPAVVAVFRIAISEAIQAPEVAQALETNGRAASRTALRKLLTEARDRKLLEGDPAQLTEQLAALLHGDLMMGLLLGVAERPTAPAIQAHTREAVAAFLRLHPLPDC